jgi:hypothetical protein
MIINIEQRRLQQEALRLANRTAEQVIEDNIKEAKQWRNTELSDTDWVLPVTDHPQHAAYITYRQLLRDWPETDSFPDTKPVLV